MKTAAVVAAIVVLAGVAIVEALDQFGASPVLAAFFPLVPLVVALVCGLREGSLGFADVMRGGAVDGTSTGWAVAGIALSCVVLVAAPIAMALAGGGGLVPLLAMLAGLSLGLYVVVPALRSTAAPTFAAAIGVRFGAPARGLAAVAVVLSLLPILAAEASLAGTIASRLLALPSWLARDLLIGVAAMAAIVGGLRAALAMAAVMAPVVAIAYLAPLAIVSTDVSPVPMPWIGLLATGGLDTAVKVPAIVVAALAVCLLAGIASLPTLLSPAVTIAKRAAGRQDLALGLVVAAAAILAAPSYAMLGLGYGIDPSTNPAGLVLNFAERAGLSAAPSVLLIGGLLTAALVAASAGFAIMAAAVGNDLYGEFVERSAPEGRRIFIARLSNLPLAGAAIALVHATDGSIATLAAIGLSIAAASLGPLLLVGWRMRKVEPLAAAAAIAVGLWLSVANIGLALFLPDVAGRFLGMGTIRATVLGPTGWFGLPVGLSGLTGVLVGLAALWALTVLPHLDWAELGRHAVRTRRRLMLRWMIFRAKRASAAVPALAQPPAPVTEAPAPASSAEPASALPADPLVAAPSNSNLP